ncbi:MAG: hypothetical protein HF982_13125 [Desulfobacteraceae bacterium]|nr:hypothetical protein [Desulfobacteraceae bacterium]MBC2720501.1 ankyrin repeat domain-containing protein [Desulfobacteraceae bacterium]
MSFLNKIFKGSLDNQLLSAISQAPENVATLLKNGAKANAESIDGTPALVFACQYDNVDVVKALLAHGANVNSKDPDNTDFFIGDSALIFACGRGHIKVVKELLKNNADTNLKNMYGNTALITATDMWNTSQGKRLKIVQELLDSGADVNATNDDSETALISAAGSSNEEDYDSLISTLLEHGADVNAATKSGKTALMHAAMRGSISAVTMLLKSGADPGGRSYSGDTASSLSTDDEIVSTIKEALHRNKMKGKPNADNEETKMHYLIFTEKIDELIAIGQPAVKYLISELEEGDEYNRKFVLKALEQLDVNAYLKFMAQNTISKLCRVSKGMAEDLWFRILLVEDDESLFASVLNSILEMHHDFNLIGVSWLGIPGVVATKRLKDSLPEFEGLFLNGSDGAKILRDKQISFVAEINNNPSGQYLVGGSCPPGYLIPKLDHKIKIAAYVVELFPYFRSDMGKLEREISSVCLPGGGDLISIVSAEDRMIEKEHQNLLKQIITNKNRTNEDEREAIEFLREIYYENI